MTEWEYCAPFRFFWSDVALPWQRALFQLGVLCCHSDTTPPGVVVKYKHSCVYSFYLLFHSFNWFVLLITYFNCVIVCFIDLALNINCIINSAVVWGIHINWLIALTDIIIAGCSVFRMGSKRGAQTMGPAGDDGGRGPRHGPVPCRGPHSTPVAARQHCRLHKGLVGFWRGYFNRKRCRRRLRTFSIGLPILYNIILLIDKIINYKRNKQAVVVSAGYLRFHRTKTL